MVRRYLLPLAVPFLVLCGTAADGHQNHPLEDDWRWSHFTTVDGLPAESILRIQEDRDGVMWASTANGLSWYDGFQWQSLVDTPGAPPQRFSGPIHARSDGGIAVLVSGTLYTGDPHGFQQVNLPGRTIDYVAPSTDGDFILLTRDAGLFLWQNNQAWPIAPPVGVQISELSKVETSDDGAVWLSCAPGKIYRLEASEWELELEMEGFLPVIASDGSRYASVQLPFEDRGLWSWKRGGSPRRIEEDRANLIRDIAVGPQQVLVIYQDGSALIGEQGRWLALEPAPLRGALDVSYADNGDLLVANGDGVRVHRSVVVPWQRWWVEDGNARNRVNEILIARNGTVWIGSDGGVEARYPDGTIEFFDHILGQDLRIVTGLGEDDEGGIWVSSGAYWEGAFRYFAGQWRFVGAEEGLRSSRIHRMASDRDGRLWFLGLQGSGSFRTQEAAVVSYSEGVFSDQPIPPPLGTARIYEVEEGPDGSHWFAGVRGLGRLRKGVWKFWADTEGIKGSKVYCIAVASDDRVFFSDQRSGLGLLEGDSVSFFDSRGGLIHDGVQDLDFDEEGILWIATRGGLGGYRDGLWLSFGTDTGLQALELWPVTTLGNKVFVGSSGQGTFILDPSAVPRSAPRIVAMDTLVTDAEALVRWEAFSHRGAQSRQSIQTRFAVDDGQWSDWSLEREVRIREPDPGTHRVRLQAHNEFGEIGGSVGVEFVVSAPYYQRPTFFIPVGLSIVAAMLSIVTLIRRRRRHEKDLQKSEARFRTFFEEAPISLWEHDYSAVQQRLLSLGPSPDTMVQFLAEHPRELFQSMKQIRVLNANRATHALLGTTPETDVSQVLHRVFRRDAFPAFGEGMGAIHQGQPRFSAQTRMYTLGGDAREIIMSWVVAPDAIDDYKRVIASVLDITAQHQAAEEMRLAVRTAEEANRAKSSFLANTSHEIRTPINAIMGMAQALLEESLTQVAEDQVDTILNASEALSRIIDDLLDLSKIEAGELDLESIRFDLAEVIEDVRRTVVGGATAKGLVLAINVAPETETDVVGDPVRIRQILLNLLANAIKFTQTGAVRVAISSQRQGPSVIFRCEVEDSGIGISADRLTDIFDPFTQADGSTTRLHGGTGLGLSISKRLVELMDGRIDVESRPGVGSTFRFSVRLLAAQGKVDSSASVPEPTPTDVSPLRILVAEDNELNLKVVRALLRSDRHGIEEVVNGQQAVEASQQKGPYDVILMDIQMPVMDGITATKMIREHEASTGAARTPIVALTANAMESDRERCMAAGMDDFVPKPVRKRALQHVLAQIASGAQSTKAAIATPVKEQGSEVIDPAPLDELRHLAALDPDFSIKSFVELFLIEAPKSLADAYTALQEADLEALHRHVHTLKGSAREVGAVKLGEAAQSLEALLNVGDTTNSLQQLRQLETLLGEASQALQKLAAEE